MDSEQTASNWLDDSTDWLGNLWDSTTDVFSGFVDSAAQTTTQYYTDWLSDSLGDSGSPENSVESTQGSNADTSNAPGVVFGLSQNQLMIGGGLVLAALFLVGRK
jgi:hypothetical protein